MSEDRALIEWAANANVGDVLPKPYRHMYGTQALIQRLVNLGVMAEPPAGSLISDAAVRAKEAATQWLSEHP